MMKQAYKSIRKTVTHFKQLFWTVQHLLFIRFVLESTIPTSREQLGSKRERENPKDTDEIPGISDG